MRFAMTMTARVRRNTRAGTMCAIETIGSYYTKHSKRRDLRQNRVRIGLFSVNGIYYTIVEYSLKGTDGGGATIDRVDQASRVHHFDTPSSEPRNQSETIVPSNISQPTYDGNTCGL